MTIFAVNAERAEQRESIAWLAAEAMYREVRLTPKPGLVDGENNGAHRDMNIALFMASIRAVSPWFPRFFAGKGDGGFACPADAIGDKAHRTGLRTGDV
jgi:triphosphoribosyl-dephospho-CoA synthase